MALTTVPVSLSATALTLTTAAQPNITSVGTLTGLTVSGNIAGTLTTAAQTNITSVGTLTGLSVNANTLTLNGTDPLISLQNGGSNHWQLGFENTQSDRFVIYDNNASSYRLIIDSSGNATFAGTIAGTLATAAQPNITSTGTLNALGIAGNLTVDTDTFHVDAANNRVGIGNTSPGSLLHVDGANSGGPIVTIHQTAGSSSADSGLDVETSSTGTYVQRWINSGTELMRVTGSGVVGIAEGGVRYASRFSVGKPHTHTPGSAFTSSPSSFFSEALLGGTTGNSQKIVTFAGSDQSNVSGLAIYRYRRATGTNWLTDGFSLRQEVDNSASIYDYINFAGGKVGIGTPTPAGLLTIKGTGDAIRVESTNAGAGGAQLDLLHHTASPADNDTPGSINFGGYYSGTNAAYSAAIRSIWTDVSAKEGKLAFLTRDDSTFAEHLTITHEGKVDINKATSFSAYPTGSQLNVYGDGEAIRMDGSGNTSRTLRFRNVSTTNPGQIIADGTLEISTEDANTSIGLLSVRDITYKTTTTNATAGSHKFYIYNTEAMRINGSNNQVKIGPLATASATSAPLHVAVANTDVQAVFGDNNSSIDDPSIRIIGRNTANSTGRYTFMGLDADNNYGKIGYNAGAGAFQDAMRMTTEGYVQKPDQPYIRCGGNSGSRVTNHGTTVDPFNNWSTATSRGITRSGGTFTVPVAGVYLIQYSFYLWMDNIGHGVSHSVLLKHGSSNVQESIMELSTNPGGSYLYDNTLSNSLMLNMALGDTFSFRVYADIYAGYTHTTMSAYLLG